MNSNKKKEKIIYAIYLLGVFGFFLVFFGRIHPVLILDTDDWFYLYNTRYALPLWGVWNPARVFPEVLSPLVFRVSVYLLYPLTESLTEAVAWGMAVLLAALLTLFAREFFMFLTSKLKVETIGAIEASLFFFICNFLIYRTKLSGNEYMLRALDATCYFYYIIPSVMGGILVMYLMRTGLLKRLFAKGEYEKKALLVLFIYFQIFSNLFSSVILVAYIGTCLLFELAGRIKNRKMSLKEYIFDNICELLIIIAWAFSHIFELGGGRASEENNTFLEGLLKALKDCVASIFNTNGTFKLAVILIVFGALATFLYYKAKDHEILKDDSFFGEALKTVLMSDLLCTLYLVLLCGKLNKYADRPDAMYGGFFFGMLLVMILLVWVLKRFSLSRLILPLLLIVMLSAIDTSDRTFLESNVENLSKEACIKINDDICSQVIEAVDNGQTEMVLKVPKFDSVDNWPLALYGGQRIPDCLYKYGIIDRTIIVTDTITNP